MLSIGKLAAGPSAGRYYVEQVAQGREDYYAGEGEAPGRWVGSGTRSLELSGSIDEGAIERLLTGRHPRTDEQLRRPVASGAVAGFDLTFRAPKSVGILFGIGEPAISAAVIAAHEAAVDDALGYVEREACRARRGKGGAIRVTGDGLVAAAFRHRSSRAGDPLLHTHVVVANETLGPDGRWTALDGRPLYAHAKTAGYLYQASLRARLTESLAVGWQPPRNGAADLLGVPRSLIEHFSQRRADIFEYMDERGEHSARAAQVATLETRRAKDYEITRPQLVEDWRARAAERGFDDVAIDAVLDRAWEMALGHLDIDDELTSAGGLTRDRSTFTRRDVLQAFAEAAVGGAAVADIEAQADAFLDGRDIVALDPVGGEPRFSTVDLIDLERALLDGARERAQAGVGVASVASLRSAVEARPSLSSEQAELVEALTESGAGVAVVRAAAGTGKTFALDAAREAWQRDGVPVLGCALSARAACELRDHARVDATTIARLEYGLRAGTRLETGVVLIVDEAGMVGTRDLATLADAVASSDGKLVLVGDDRQLPEIQAGGAFAALADELGAIELHEVRRQADDWDRDALAALRGGDVETFAAEYHEHGRLIAAPTAEQTREVLIDDWWQAQEEGGDALIIAHRRRDVDDLNARARTRMRDAGRLGRDELTTERHGFAVGDQVIAGRNDRRLEIVNGDRGVIREVGETSLSIDVGDRTLELPHGYAHDGHLAHGYAVTAHRAQGATVDRAFVLGSDELYREWGYTALSRHRSDACFYVSAQPDFLNTAPEPLTTGEDVELVVASMLRGSRAEHLASHGVAPDYEAEIAARRLEHEREWQESAERRVEALTAEQQSTPWWRRGARGELGRALASAERWRDEAIDRAADLRAELDAFEPPRTPDLWRAHDPLDHLDLPDLGPDLTPDLGRDLADLDLDLDIGPGL